MEQAGREGWALHFADLDIDTSTPAGEMAANIIIAGSQYERRLISQRTRDALAAKRARGERLGAAPALPLEVTRRIITERAEGRTFQPIADELMAEGIPTARGKHRWARQLWRWCVSATWSGMTDDTAAGSCAESGLINPGRWPW